MCICATHCRWLLKGQRGNAAGCVNNKEKQVERGFFNHISVKVFLALIDLFKHRIKRWCIDDLFIGSDFISPASRAE